MTLTEALTTLSNPDRRRVEESLKVLGEFTALCYRFRLNLECETRLSLEAWGSVFEALLNVDSQNDPEVIRKCLIISLRDWTLHGPIISSLGEITFGRAITLDYFCRLLVGNGYFGSIQKAKQNIRHMLLKPKALVATRWRNYDLGRYLMWSTFSTEGEDIFSFMPKSADGIRGVLGLDRNERGLPLLLFTYNLPVNVEPRYPTVAEAYAGDRWNYFFTPAPHTACYGLTIPWPEYEDQPPQPEVVHEVIKAVHIAGPIVRVP